MFGKLVDGALIPAPKMLQIGDRVCYQPSSKILAEQGYSEVVDTPYPEEEGYYEFKYEKQDNKIIKVWYEAEPPAEPALTPTVADRLTALEAGLKSTQQGLDATMEAVDYLLLDGVAEND